VITRPSASLKKVRSPVFVSLQEELITQLFPLIPMINFEINFT